MGLSISGRTWEEASSPAAVRLARRFETAWRDSRGRGHSPRPDPEDFLGADDAECPGARLALLRTDLALRWEAGECVGAEWYRDRYAGLGDETLVALVYEEYCLREEAHEAPDPAEYLARFPEVASRLRRVFDIHGLVGSGQTTATHAPGIPEIPFPEAGQTIAGFHLVEELGRGAFARVFLAEERQLADRPVALKVARTGSREPQTLARLQHTHIVPVHSTRTDPATGLHLLCMPYFGRVTLARLLGDPKARTARSGAELIEALDRLGSERPPAAGRSTGRDALAGRSFAQAIAWWGSRMAEALEHAHERGVLHRDIKPSNVLVTGDGMPMLLDFNLARETVADDPDAGPATLGGTLDYMAPEHLEALADGLARNVDARSDIYGLGVLLYEALVGERPFATPRGARSAAELLLRAAEERRAGVPRLRAAHPEVPAPLEAIIRCCLSPAPEDRYPSATELAADLQAVADDRPLRFAREPLASRAVRWSRRNRRALAMAAPVLAAVLVVAGMLFKVQLDRLHLEDEAVHQIAEAREAAEKQDFTAAVARYEMVSRLTAGHPELLPYYKTARERARLAQMTGDARAQADVLFREAEPLRFRLMRFVGDLETATTTLKAALRPFSVLQKNPDWIALDLQKLLDGGRQERLLREINELLFLWVVAVARERPDDREALEDALRLCDRVVGFAKPAGPWRTLQQRLGAQLGRPARQAEVPGGPSGAETSALACFQWGQLGYLEGRRREALDWFRQAAWKEERNYWYHYYLAFVAGEMGQSDEALRHYQAAVSLADRSPWAHLGRGEAYQKRGAFPSAWDDFQQARAGFESLRSSLKGFDGEPELRLTRLALGYVRQRRGDLSGARADYDRLIAGPPDDRPGRAARLNRALLDATSGAIDRARHDYDWLVSADPADRPARLGRALLALQAGDAQPAEADFTELVRRTDGRDAVPFAGRALARLRLSRRVEARADAAEANRLDPSPAHERLLTRTLLALGQVHDLPTDRPEVLAELPGGWPALAADLRKGTERLRDAAEGHGAEALRARLARATFLAALGDPAAEAEAGRAVGLAPLSPRVHLVRGRVRRRLGAFEAALADAEQGLRLDEDDPRLLELRGTLKTETGDPRGGLADFDRLIRQDQRAPVRGPRAAALLALGDAQGALRDGTIALERDPEDPHLLHARARAHLALQHEDLALVDLEHASAWALDRPGLSLRIALTSLRCLRGHPDLRSRVAILARHAWTAARSAWPPHAGNSSMLVPVAEFKDTRGRQGW